MHALKSQIQSLLRKNHRNRRGRLKSVTALVVLTAFVAASVVGTTGIIGTAMADDTYCCGLEEHIHTADCYTEDGSILTCDIPEHIHTEDCLTDLSAGQEEAWEPDGAAEQTAEEQTAAEPVTYMAGSDGVEVSVTVPSDALPEDAQLQVILYDEGSVEYARALSLTENAADADDNDAISTLGSPGDAETEEEDEGEEIPLSFSFGDAEDTESDTTVMDIFFLSDGLEVEPESSADVTIDASELLAASDSPVESLQVWHLEEKEVGTEPVLVAEISDPDVAAAGVAEFTVDSFSQFTLHCNRNGGGWAGLGINLYDLDNKEISGTLSDATRTVNMPYVINIADFIKDEISISGSYQYAYATITDPNYYDVTHDLYPDLTNVGTHEQYGSEDNPITTITIYMAADADSSYGQVSKTWGYDIEYADGEIDTILIYGNSNGNKDNGGAGIYCPQFLELNLYFEKGSEVVLNLGNGNGTNSDGDYTGSNSSGGDALRYGTGSLNDYADAGKVTINLPSDNDLAEKNDETVSFTVVDETDDLPAVTVELGKEQAYDYKLVGWINIATDEYYDVSGGTVTAEVDLENDNVFYADWIAASYDHGSSSDEGLKETVSTASFVNFDLFDYNELFDLYSVKLEQNGTDGESWTDSGTMYTEPLLGNDPDTVPILKGEDENKDKDTDSFIFQNNGTTRSSAHVLSHANPARWNMWTANSAWSNYPEYYNFVLDANTFWNITGPDSTVLGMLYDKDEKSLGVHYVGSGDYLFWVDEGGYYTYDSAVSGAAYNQTDQRFYVYEDKANSFYPYNNHTDERTYSNGLTNYWFGMSMNVKFYLLNNTNSGTPEDPVNQVNDNDMIFDFSGDDDIMIFVDDKLVVDMSGIHSTSYSRINFTTNTVTYSMGLDEDGAPDTSGAHGKYSINENLDLSAGFHTLTVRYMERGASESNLKIKFNVAPTWEYDSWPVQTVTAEKVWVDSSGNEIDPEDLPEIYKDNGVEVGLFDALGLEVKAEEADPEDSGKFGYTTGQDGNGNTTYTVKYEDDDGTTHEYVYTVYTDGSNNGASLTYTEYDENNIPTANETYKNTDDEGRVVDSSGYVIAWLEDETLHIRIDEQTLSEKNGWTYAWEMLDADGSYEVLELSGSSSYFTTSKEGDLTEYNYWSIIGETEIEDNLNNPDFSIILTEAAQETTGTLGDTQEAYGWVIVATEDGITAEQVKFSHVASMEGGIGEYGNIYYSMLGVTSQSEINVLGSGAVWYLVDSGEIKEEVGDAKEFYLYCLLNGTTYYLALREDGDSLIVTQNAEEANLFYYDFLGELRVVRSDGLGTDRVVISQKGEVSLDVAENEADTDDVRFYTLKETDTTGFSFTATNKFLPDITLKKVDSNTGEPLEGVSFSLKNEAGLYYGYLDETTDEVVWVTTWSSVQTDENGKIEFHYLADGTYTLTEEVTPEGYLALPSAITITIENGNIKSAVWTAGGLASGYSSLINVDQENLTITVKNLPDYELPNAGGPGITWFYLAGGLMMISSVVLLAYRFRRKFAL